MTNKEYYGFNDELVEAINKFLDKRGCVFEDLKTAIEGFWNFCRETKCQKCPFFENDKEPCFIKWLNKEMNKDIVFIERSGKRYRLHETDEYMGCSKCAFTANHIGCPKFKNGELICCNFSQPNIFWREVEEVGK